MRLAGIAATEGRLMQKTTETTTETALPRAPHGTASTSRSAEDLSNAKVLPPSSPVDVPARPPKAPAAKDAAQGGSEPVEDATSESSWADNTRPAPAKKNVRNSNIF